MSDFKYQVSLVSFKIINSISILEWITKVDFSIFEFYSQIYVFLYLVDTNKQLLPNPQHLIRFEFLIIIEEYKYGNSNAYLVL